MLGKDQNLAPDQFILKFRNMYGKMYNLKPNDLEFDFLN